MRAVYKHKRIMFSFRAKSSATPTTTPPHAINAYACMMILGIMERIGNCKTKVEMNRILSLAGDSFVSAVGSFIEHIIDTNERNQKQNVVSSVASSVASAFKSRKREKMEKMPTSYYDDIVTLLTENEKTDPYFFPKYQRQLETEVHAIFTGHNLEEHFELVIRSAFGSALLYFSGPSIAVLADIAWFIGANAMGSGFWRELCETNRLYVKMFKDDHHPTGCFDYMYRGSPHSKTFDTTFYATNPDVRIDQKLKAFVHLLSITKEKIATKDPKTKTQAETEFETLFIHRRAHPLQLLSWSSGFNAPSQQEQQISLLSQMRRDPEVEPSIPNFVLDKAKSRKKQKRIGGRHNKPKSNKYKKSKRA